LIRAALRTELVLWLLLFAGFSPVIAQFARFEARHVPSTLVAPVLVAICLWSGRDPAEPPRRAAGWAMIALGLALELVGGALRAWTLAWSGFPIAAVGMALWRGTPSWRVAALALGLVAIPVSLRGLGTPAPESAVLSGACAVWRALGAALSCTGPVARLGDRRLELMPDDVGWMLVPLLAQLGWFLAVCAGVSARRALGAALAFAAAGLVIAPLAIGIAVGILAFGSEAAARAFLSPGVWLGCAAAAVLASLRAPLTPSRTGAADTSRSRSTTAPRR
jgi:hypothetical protein